MKHQDSFARDYFLLIDGTANPRWVPCRWAREFSHLFTFRDYPDDSSGRTGLDVLKAGPNDHDAEMYFGIWHDGICDSARIERDGRIFRLEHINDVLWLVAEDWIDTPAGDEWFNEQHEA